MKPKCYSYIRFSSSEQSKGDSLRRQTEAAEKWAEKNGMSLDSTTRLKDLGLSAYNGTHRDKGALGGFLELIAKGMIAPGSVLLVENLDRLSREEITEALEQFLAIIRRGIKIVALADNDREYTKETINASVGDLIVSLTIMSRAHEESQIKSYRSGQSWKNKRNQIADKKMTARAPAWLELSEDKSTFKVFDDRAATIERIFQMKLDGIGGDSIARILNAEKVKWTEGKGHRAVLKNGWRKSYIDKIIRGRAVLGEFQPHSTIDKKRQPVGDPITDYFPQIISDELFYAVQRQMASNRGKGGRNGELTNLFGALAFCGYCGRPMQRINKGQTPKGGQYLICDSAHRGRGCVRHPIRYQEFEELILTYCTGLSVNDLLPDAEQVKSEIQGIRQSLAGIKGKLAEIDSNIDNLSKSIASTHDQRVRERLEISMEELFDQIDDLKKNEKVAQDDLNKLESASEINQQRIDSIKDLYVHLGGDNSLELRLMLRSKLRSLITRIVVYPAGFKRAKFQAIAGVSPKVIANKINEKLEAGDYDNRDRRVYTIVFETGNSRTISPNHPNIVESDYDASTGRTIHIDRRADVENMIPFVNVDLDDRFEVFNERERIAVNERIKGRLNNKI